MSTEHAVAVTSLSAEASCFTAMPPPEDGSAGALLSYWRDKRGARAMPSRADIRPAELRAHLPKLLLLDPVEDGDFHIRLFGSQLVDTFGMELTGRRVSMVRPEVVAAKWGQLARACVSSAGPVAAHTRMAAGERFHMFYEVLLLPLSSDGVAVTQILGHVRFPADAPGATERWIPAALRPVFGDAAPAPDAREKRPPLPRERRFLMRSRPG